ncbi:MAG: 4-hydroxy-tetrahydrodipicolinate synthase [Chloroflexi bacterium]|nr:4-hydroxy-tetrahydrodipicolinate synthase [Chloroflexota bacterium]
MTAQPFGRLITAMATPFAENGSVDYPRARQLARALVASGTESLVVSGTTGEAPTLSSTEKLRLFETTREAVGQEAAIIAGTGNYNTAESIELSREAAKIGVDGILGTVPYYNKPPQAGLEAHFRALADAVDLPILLYNVPSRTATNMLPETTVRLSEVPNIVGIKEASSNFEAIGQIIRESADGFLVWSGNDGDTLPIMALGGYGVVSVASHLVGRQMARLIDAVVEGSPEAAQIHAHLAPLFTALFVTTSPIPLKYALRQVGFSCGGHRLPLVDIDAKSAAIMDAALAIAQIDLPSPADI